MKVSLARCFASIVVVLSRVIASVNPISKTAKKINDSIGSVLLDTKRLKMGRRRTRQEWQVLLDEQPRGAHRIALGLLLRHSARSRTIQEPPGSERSKGLSGCCDYAQHDGVVCAAAQGVCGMAGGVRVMAMREYYPRFRLALPECRHEHQEARRSRAQRRARAVLKTNSSLIHYARSLITAVQNRQPFWKGHVLREISHGPFIGQHILQRFRLTAKFHRRALATAKAHLRPIGLYARFG